MEGLSECKRPWAGRWRTCSGLTQRLCAVSQSLQLLGFPHRDAAWLGLLPRLTREPAAVGGRDQRKGGSYLRLTWELSLFPRRPSDGAEFRL